MDNVLKNYLLKQMETEGWSVLSRLRFFDLVESVDILDTMFMLEEESGIKLPIRLIENTWYPNGGWGNGYVKLPKNHKYYGVDYDNIPVDAPGGLTYSEQDGDEWVVGFDTMHSWNNAVEHDKDYVLTETMLLLYELYNA